MPRSARCCVRLPPCGQTYGPIGSIQILLPDPPAHVRHWRMQLGLILSQASETIAFWRRRRASSTAVAPRGSACSLSLARSQTKPTTSPPCSDLRSARRCRRVRSRCRAERRTTSIVFSETGRGREGMTRRTPAPSRRFVGSPRAAISAGLSFWGPVRAGSPTTCIPVAAEPRPLSSTSTPICSSSPRQSSAAAAVGSTETSVNAPEVEPVSCRWTLSAPSGPLGAEVFHFFLADGLEPPFADQSSTRS